MGGDPVPDSPGLACQVSRGSLSHPAFLLLLEDCLRAPCSMSLHCPEKRYRRLWSPVVIWLASSALERSDAGLSARNERLLPHSVHPPEWRLENRERGRWHKEKDISCPRSCGLVVQQNFPGNSLARGLHICPSGISKSVPEVSRDDFNLSTRPQAPCGWWGSTQNPNFWQKAGTLQLFIAICWRNELITPK